MIKINLLPQEIQAERKSKSSQGKMMQGIVFLVVLLVAAFGGIMAMTLQGGSRVLALEAQRAQLQAEIDSYAPVVALQGQVNNRAELVTEVMGPQLPWREALTSVGIHIPENVWLTNFSLRMDGEHGEMNMRGITFDHPSAASWIGTLYEIQGFSNVRTSFSAEEAMNDEERVRFEVSTLVTADVEYDPLAKGE
jgi:Tfp pilus assembly protein PilN